MEKCKKPYFQKLQVFLERERKAFNIYPHEEDTFQALELTPYSAVNVLLLGQDPYLGPKQGHGLCFSVKKDVAIPASLKNIYQELAMTWAAASPTMVTWLRGLTRGS